MRFAIRYSEISALFLLLALSAFGQAFTLKDTAWMGTITKPASGGGGGGATNVTRGLANQWKFLEGSGTTTADSIGSANGSFIQGVGTVDWRSDGGISSVGIRAATDSKIQLSTNSSPGPGAMSLSMWFWPSNANPSGSFVMDYSTGANDLGYNFFLDDATHLAITFGSSSVDAIRRAVITGSGLPSGAWIHLAATWDGTINPATGIHIYTNGVEDSNYSSTSGLGTYGGPNTSTARNIGGPGSANGTGVTGGYSDVRIFNVQLNAAEITNLFGFGRQ